MNENRGQVNLSVGVLCMRRYLVVVRAGNSSLHSLWVSGDCERTWDMIISYYGAGPKPREKDGIVTIPNKGPKWRGLSELFESDYRLHQSYEYIWLPDDDLECKCQDINRFFAICESYQMALTQPSLSADSFVAHPIVIHNPQYSLRFTNFVEVMAPCFRVDALRKCLPTFRENVSGWGLDYVWPQLLASPCFRIGVIDAVQVCHTRPVGGPTYSLLASGIDEARDEMKSLLAKYGIERPSLVSHGAVGIDGRELSAHEFLLESPRWLMPPW